MNSTNNTDRTDLAEASPIVERELLQTIMKKWGCTLYICSLAKFKENLSKFLQPFRNRYPDTVLGYSYKTNFLPQICQMADHLGHYAEVVSEFEYALALRFGVTGEKIIFNGPAKSQVSIDRALAAGSKINLDSVREIELSAAFAKQNKDRRYSVGVRLNLSQDQETRFGIDPESEDFRYALKIFEETSNLRLAGLHSHANTAGRTCESYATRIGRMINVARESSVLPSLDYLDLGGGFFGELETDLVENFSCRVPTFADYADAVTTVLLRQLPNGCAPTLILEPGVGVVANAMSFVCKVESVKRICGSSHAIVSGGIQNMRPNLDPFNLPLFHYSCGAERSVPPPVQISGYTCMEGDILANDYNKPVCEGDILMFRNTGAYSFVFKPPFIRGDPPIVVVGEDGTSSLARRNENADDFLQCYNFEASKGRNT